MNSSAILGLPVRVGMCWEGIVICGHPIIAGGA